RPTGRDVDGTPSPDLGCQPDLLSTTTRDKMSIIRAVSCRGRDDFHRGSAGMAPVTSRSVARQIESLFHGDTVSGLTDRQLLERFLARRDAAGGAAFAALVSRHGPMVLHVCRQLLGDRHHAEDAFQATFLVLARKARSIRDSDLMSHWLYG